MNRLKIRDWERFQHYKHRRPPWIRLYVEIIEQYDTEGQPKKFYLMDDTAKLTFVALICLASHYGGIIPTDNIEWLKARTGVRAITLAPLFEAGFIVAIKDASVAASAGASDVLPTESDTESDTDTENTGFTLTAKPPGHKGQEKQSKGFCPPTAANVAEYCRERSNGIDSQAFVDFYASKGWMIGKNKMKDWKAAVRTWERNNRQRPANDADAQPGEGMMSMPIIRIEIEGVKTHRVPGDVSIHGSDGRGHTGRC